MGDKKPTEEQKLIFHYIDKRKENLLISARAGTGKTQTIVAGSSLLPKDKNIIFLAFNKHIQEELKGKLPEYVRCSTLHALGFGAIRRKYGDDIQLDEFKIDKILKKKEKSWKLEEEIPDYLERRNYLNQLKKLIDLCRLTLTLDKKYIPYLAEKYDIRLSSPKEIKRILSVLEIDTNDKKTVDFTDMIYLPAIDPKIWLFPQDYIFLDEGQDISRAQQKMIEKLIKRNRKTGNIEGRLIVVADEFQNIYSFAGADSKSFEWFRKFPNTKELPLTHTFRCGVNIVNEARKLVPDIKPMENAHLGIVREGNVVQEPIDGDFVLCRKTSPLVILFFLYLLEGKKATIRGKDIGISLLEMIEGHKTIGSLLAFWQNELKKFGNELKKTGILDFEEHSGYSLLLDRINVIIFLSKLSKDIEDLKNKINIIFSDEINGIMLSTVHKAKGLESDRVFIARPDLLPMRATKAWQAEQERNIHYVAITRARHELIFDYKWTDETVI